MAGKATRIALRTSIFYAFFGVLWISLTDRLVVAIWSDPHTISKVETYKGWAFVLFTALLLCGTLRGQLRSWAHETERRRRAEERLRRYELMANHTEEIIFFIEGEKGRVLEANAAAVKAYGYNREELLALTVHDLRAPEERGLIPGQLAEARLQGARFETVHRRKDGSTFPVEVSSQGASIGGTATLMSVIRDISARKRSDEALRAAREELEVRVRERTAELQKAYETLKEETAERESLQSQLRHAQKMEALGTLAGGIAHDFNNILAAVIGFTELIQDRLSEEDVRQRRYAERVLEASMRGRELVRQMLTFTRKTEQEKKPLRMSAIIRETINFVRATTPANVNIRSTIMSESGMVLADPTQIQQVIMNLCTNAVHAMQEKGGLLDIGLSDFVASSDNVENGVEPGPYMKLTVSDTGTGMSSDVAERIFDPFFTTKRPGEGTGLGLSVVHGIVKGSGGHILMESSPGKGSCFTVYLPRVVPDSRADRAAAREVLPTGTERILFVDDEEALVEMGKETLSQLGYEVVSLTKSAEALALFRLDPRRFDLIITDQTMPEMTGIEFAREIHAIEKNIPVIMCTGFSHSVDHDKSKAAGVNAFVMKPLTKKEIARAIRVVLDEKRK